MNANDEMLREIESGERWLGEVCHEPPPPGADRIKLRVRIAAQEVWLQGQLDATTPAYLAERAKQTVRTAIGEDRAAPGSSPRSGNRYRRVAWWASGVAAAAAIVLFAFVGFGDRGEARSGLSFVEAFESMGESDLEMALSALATDVADLEDELGDSWLAQADDWSLMSIGDEIDNVLTDPAGDDWL
ncbi:MAG: hypothetical protein IIB57_03670 [Planctomycetes bacterium]|nr:hypothetical protein [Planctomycetota bacterium]